MKTYICKGRSETSGKIYEFEIQANNSSSAYAKAKDACFTKDLVLIELKEKVSGPFSKKEVF